MRFNTTVLFILIFVSAQAQNLPLGYMECFNADFNQTSIPENLLISNRERVKINTGKLVLSDSGQTDAGFAPGTAIIIDKNSFGEFIAEVVVNARYSSDSNSAIFILSGLRNAENYYFIKLSRQGASFYKMYKSQITLISLDSGFVVPEKQAVKISVSRDILKRSIKLTMKGKTTEFFDPNLVMGYFGLGVSNANAAIDRMKIWAPTSINEPLLIF